MSSVPVAVAFQYSSSGVGTGAPFCINHRPGDWAATIAIAMVMIAAQAPCRLSRTLLRSFARSRAKLLARCGHHHGFSVGQVRLVSPEASFNSHFVAGFEQSPGPAESCQAIGAAHFDFPVGDGASL